MSLEDRLRKALSSRRDGAPGPDCPGPGELAAFVAGDRREAILDHLADCASCREDALVARAHLSVAPRPEAPRHGWVAAAAAVLFASAIGAALLIGRHEPEPVVLKAPRPAPRIEAPKPPPAPPLPAPRPEPPKPAPRPEEKPLPRPEPPMEPVKPVIATPTPEPPKPAPKLESRTEPAITKAKLRGALLAVAGGCSTRTDGDATWQGVRLAQPREFTANLKVRTDLNALKARIGAATYYLRGSSELAVTLEEGTTLVRLSRGEAFFDVTPGQDLFVVETGSGKVTVKGTRFLVTAGEVAVQRGGVEFASSGRTVAVSAGERSVEARPPEKTDLAKRLAWMKPLEETLTIEAEGMALQQGMALHPDPTASGGRSIFLKGAPAPNSEPAAEIRLKRKQPSPYAVWIRLNWHHNVAPGFTVQVHAATPWSGKDVASRADWQWVKVGTYELPDEPFKVRLVDPRGGLRVDQLLLTSDLDFTPESR